MPSNIIKGLLPLATPIDELVHLEGNARQGEVQAIKKSLDKLGQHKPLVVRRNEDGQNEVLIGNHTLMAARELGWDEIAVLWVEDDETTAKARALADNRTSELGGFDDDLLAGLIADVLESNEELLEAASYSQDDLEALLADSIMEIDEEPPQEPASEPQEPQEPAQGPEGVVAPAATSRAKLSLFDRFLVPPFTVLNARDGWWVDRKRAWIDLGLEGELGRDDKPRTWYIAPPTHHSGGVVPEGAADRKRAGEEDEEGLLYGEGSTSIFDPVLCELAYRWFCPPGGTVLDPFAGGSVRGVVASRLGRNYIGIELREVQVAANEQQRIDILTDTKAIVPDVPADNTPEYTDVEWNEDRGIWLKREDTYSFAGVRGAKVRTCVEFIKDAKKKGTGVVTAGARHSPQVNFVAQIANRLGVRCRVHVPSGALTPELLAARAAGAKVIQHEYGYNTVIVARAREDAQERGWIEIPYGMESPQAVEFTAPQVKNIPAGVKRIVNATGSGMTLAGILNGLKAEGRNIPVLGVCVGSHPEDRLDEWAPKDWRDMVELVTVPTPYEVPATETMLDGVPLDPYYEAKCLPYLEEGDLFWLSAIRPSAVPAEAPDPVWITGDALNLAELVPADTKADMIFTCHPAGTVILGMNGLTPIEEVQEGDLVISHSGKPRIVTKTFQFDYTGDLFIFHRDYATTPLAATAEHPLLVWRDGSMEWRRADEVRAGDALVEPVPVEPDKILDGETIWEYDEPERSSNRGRRAQGVKALSATSDLCRLVGYYLAEGSCSKGSAQFAFHADETEYHEDVISRYKATFGGDLGARLVTWGDGKQSFVGCNGVVAVDFFSTSCGRGAANKSFPSWVWDCSDELLTEVVIGAWRGDGWIEKSGRMGFGTISQQLAEDMRRSLLRLGVIARVRCRVQRKSNYATDPAPFWTLEVRGVHADTLASLLGEEIITPPHRRPGRGPWIDEGFAHYKVRSIDVESVEALPVFNIEVDEDHSYLAEGVVSHNCPPYGDLEVYSDDPADLSTMEYPEFIMTFGKIMDEATNYLADDSFVVVVVGDYRDEEGYYHNFPGDTIKLMQDAGLNYLNEAILVTQLASLPIRTGRQFDATRKLGKTHQQALVFVKGDARRATQRCGPVVAMDITETPE